MAPGCAASLSREPHAEVLATRPPRDSAPDADGVALREKLAFLSRPEAYSPPVSEVHSRETHMSWVFLAGDKVYKLKKPVRFPYLDFSTRAKREAACRAEVELNRRLAPEVYLSVEPLMATASGLAIGGDRGLVADWLVVMRRLDERRSLERAIIEDRVKTWQLDRLVDALVHFYRRAAPAFVSPDIVMADWRRNLSYNRSILLEAKLRMPAGLVRQIDQAQRRFLSQRRRHLAARMSGRRIVDGHGDLRPEHIWLGDPVMIIDCLEFNARLRAVDPIDEVAFLSLECERLGAPWVGHYLRRRIMFKLRDAASDEVFLFYRCHRAMLRARLAIAHLLEPDPRTPEKWPRLARTYLRLAAADARRLQTCLRKPEDRRAAPLHAAVRSFPQAAGRRSRHAVCRAPLPLAVETAERRR